MPDLQYVEGDFRPPFSAQLNIGDVKLPASGAIFDLSGSFDKQEIEKEVAEALLRQDRFKPIQIGGLPDNVVGVAYYGWQTSRLLTRHFFPEWTLGVCVLINEGNLVLAHDTEGIVFDAERLGLSRIEHINRRSAKKPPADSKAGFNCLDGRLGGYNLLAGHG
jgi:hypothetical protein